MLMVKINKKILIQKKCMEIFQAFVVLYIC